ncbi:MAG TPA: hypothetical protein VN739_01350 [Nitrososphaerales archaeon]|nr:hypothetical protein [Nitrososphaerales archaeon]
MKFSLALVPDTKSVSCKGGKLERLASEPRNILLNAVPSTSRRSEPIFSSKPLPLISPPTLCIHGHVFDEGVLCIIRCVHIRSTYVSSMFCAMRFAASLPVEFVLI